MPSTSVTRGEPSRRRSCRRGFEALRASPASACPPRRALRAGSGPRGSAAHRCRPSCAAALITSSYSSRFLRMSKLRSSTFFCAFSTLLVTHGARWARRRACPCAPSGSSPCRRRRCASGRLRATGRSATSPVALAAGAAAELVVDAARLVPLGAEDVQAAELARPRRPRSSHCASDLLDELLELLAARRRACGCCSLNSSLREHLRVAAEDDVGAAAGHVGRDGDGALAAGLGHDVRLARVVLRVEHSCGMLFLSRMRAMAAALLDAGRADQDGLPALVVLDDLVDDRGELLALGLVDEVLGVDADDRACSSGWR